MRTPRLIAALAATTLLALLPVAPSVAAPQAGNEALKRLGACISGGGEADMLLLIDRSGSLKRTDPTGARVDAGKYVVRQMSGVADAYHWKVNVAVAGFDRNFNDGKPVTWAPLNPGTMGAVESTIEAFRSQADGLDTDYWAALDGSRRELGQRATLGHRCSFVVWFSDGELDVDPRPRGAEPNDRKPYAAGNALATQADVDAAMRAGRDDLCRPGGVADQTRSQDVITLAVGLSTPDSQPDFGLLKSIATGEGGCGSITSPVPGAFFTADGIDQLYQAFDSIAAPGHEAMVLESDVCSAGVACPTGTHRFVLDASIGGVHALATTGAPGQKVVLTGPRGQTVEFTPGGQAAHEVPGAKLSGSWMSDRSVTFNLTRTSDDGWIGGWGISFVAPADGSGRARSSLRLYGDLLPVAVDVDKLVLRSGDRAEINLGLGRADGPVRDPASVSSTVLMSASLVQGGTEVPIAKGLDKAALARPVHADLTKLTPGQAALRLTLDVTTAEWTTNGQTVPGTQLEPQARDYAVTIMPPASYPVVPAVVDFGTVTETGRVTASLKLEGDGCAWLTDAKPLTAPKGADPVSVTSSATSKETCATGTVPFAIDVKNVGNGLASGTLSLNTLPVDKAGAAVPATVKYQLDMNRPVDAGVLWAVLVGVTLAGVAIPVGLLYLLKFATAKIPGENVASASVRGRVDQDVSFVADGVPITAQDLGTTVLAGSDRRRVVVGGRTLVAKAGANPIATGFVLVEQPGVAAGGRLAASSVKGQAKLPLAVQGNWCVALDHADPHGGDVEITVFTAAGGAGLPELLEDVRANVGDWVARLRSGVPAAPASAPVDEWGGGTATGPASDEWGGTATTSTAAAWGGTPTVGSSGSAPAYPITYQAQNSTPRPPAAPPADDEW